MRTLWPFASFVILSFLPACSCGYDVDLGGNRDTGLDGSRPGGPRDECGNGLDDDGDGAIDDGCPCAPGETHRCFSGALASNGVGACMGGTQTCPGAAAEEFSTWGLAPCVGETLPSAEACDGRDADCDGAVDEGCPCTAGATRACADEFVVAPCMAGAQRCEAGVWSACEGAVGPSADVCEDDVDNDCDGVVNESCSCMTPPTPERCRDGIDNDCDGEIDEPECSPDWGRDAGMPTDAGPVDAGARMCPTFEGASCTALSVPLDLPAGSTHGVSLAAGDCEIGLVLRDDDGTTAGTRFERYSPDGTRLSRTMLGDVRAGLLAHGSMGWAIASVVPTAIDRGDASLLLLDDAGTTMGAPIALASGVDLTNGAAHALLTWAGDHWLFAFGQGTVPRFVSIDPVTRAVVAVGPTLASSNNLTFASSESELLVGSFTGGPSSRVLAQRLDLRTLTPRDAGYVMVTGADSVPSNARFTAIEGGWLLAYVNIGGASASPLRVRTLDAALAAGPASDVLPTVRDSDFVLVAGSHNVSLAASGSVWAVGYALNMRDDTRAVRFYSGGVAEEPLALGTVMADSYATSLVLTTPRRTVLRSAGAALARRTTLHLLCDP